MRFQQIKSLLQLYQNVRAQKFKKTNRIFMKYKQREANQQAETIKKQKMLEANKIRQAFLC